MGTAIHPATLEHLDALIAGGDAYEQRFGMTVADGYLDFPDVLGRSRVALLRGVPAEWLSHVIVDPAPGQVIGFGGFKGPPRDGCVEVGYGLAPSHRGHGHATAAVHAMIELARAASVQIVCAHTPPEENASTRVLERCEFSFAGVDEDREGGAVWRWELEL